MNFGCTQHSSSKLGSAFVCTKFLNFLFSQFQLHVAEAMEHEDGNGLDEVGYEIAVPTPDFEAVNLLCQSVGTELAALENEIEKLALYAWDRTDKKITQEDVLACIGFSKEENPFELANAILSCNKTKALKLVTKLLDDGEEPVAVLSKMTFPILKMARIKRLSEGGVPSGDIIRAAGLFPWEGRLVSSARSFPNQKQFLTTLNRLIEADAAFKSGTGSDPQITLKGILLTLFR